MKIKVCLKYPWDDCSWQVMYEYLTISNIWDIVLLISKKCIKNLRTPLQKKANGLTYTISRMVFWFIGDMNFMPNKAKIFLNWHWLTFSCGCNMKMTHEASQRQFSNMTIVWPKVSRLDSHIYWHLFVLNQSPLTIYVIFVSFIHHLIQEHICENVWQKGLSVDNFVSTLFLHCICLGNSLVSL